MRIMIHAPYPEMPTGYANQVRWFAPRMRAAGHDVAISCTAGIVRHNTTWRGMPVYGRGPYTDMAEDLVRFHYRDFKADLIITLCCPWKLHGQVWKDMRTIHLMPVDREPLGVPDYYLLQDGGGMPAAVSRFGERVMRAAGLDPLYLPHAVDTAAWTPLADRAALRKGMGIDHLFVVGMNASNTDADDRKQFFETLAGFARFREEHPWSVLSLHAAAIAPDGLDLLAIGEHFGINDAMMFTDQYQLGGAGAPEDALRAWYGSLDVLVQLGNEGYGIPAAEAMACGTPVIAGTWSTGPELAGETGWLVQGQQRWNGGHKAAWHVPFITSVTEMLTSAHATAGDCREMTRQFALENLDADTLWEEHWVPVLKDLEGLHAVGAGAEQGQAEQRSQAGEALRADLPGGNPAALRVRLRR